MPRLRHPAGVALLASALTLAFAQQATAASPNVAALQVALKSRGLYASSVDGVRGPLTRRGVIRFQRRRGLAVDGVAGPQTRAALGRRGRPSLGSRWMTTGSRGWDVAALQFMLARRGHSPGGVDGLFGAGTRSAVVSFQSASGLGADGIAGPATLGALRGRTWTAAGPVRFFRPVPGPIGDGFGAPREAGRRHQGLDFPVAAGTRIGAGGVGTVAYAGWNSGGYGNLVVVQHRLGYSTWYAHMSTVSAYVGQPVAGGTLLGYVGSTGHSTGPHLHFEVRLNNVPVDPMPYLLAGVASARAGSASTQRPRPDYATVKLAGPD